MTPHIVRHAWYSRFAKAAARFSGRPRIFTLAVAMIGVWLVTGPLFRFSDTWQLVINTSTTIVTFLMVFLIQNTQNRDTEAIQVKPVMAACPRCRGCKTGECVASTIAYEGQFSTQSGHQTLRRKAAFQLQWSTASAATTGCPQVNCPTGLVPSPSTSSRARSPVGFVGTARPVHACSFCATRLISKRF